MECIKDKVFLEYFNNELSRKRKESLEKHINNCTNCRNKFLQWQKTKELTTDFVKADKENMPIPDFDFKKLEENIICFNANDTSFPWVRYWIKPAIAVAMIILVSISVLFFPKRDNMKNSEANILFVNDYLSEPTVIEINQENYTYIEKAILEEIYEDNNLREQILSGYFSNSEYLLSDDFDYQNISQTDLQLLEQELNKLKSS